MRTDSSNSSIQILIAEDSPTQVQKLRHILEREGFAVRIATNGRKAIEAALEATPTLIISDVVMPEMDGYELCRCIKSEPSLENVPVILVTTLSDPQAVIRGLECGADNFILKPYDDRYLVNRVRFVLANRELLHRPAQGTPLEVFFFGEKHLINSDRLQILNLLLSTYEAAMQQNKELSRARDSLRQANMELHHMALELENRVSQRTRELTRANEALQTEIAERKQTEVALRQSQELLQAVIDNSTTVIYIKDLHGRYLLANRRFVELFRTGQETVIGKTDFDFFPRETAEAFRAMDQRALAAGEALTEEEVTVQSDGPHTYLSVKCPLRDDSSRAYAVFGVSTDITERKQAQEKMRAQVERLHLLDRTTRAISERQDLTQIFHVVLRSLEDHLRTDLGFVCLYDRSAEAMTVAAVGTKGQAMAREVNLAPSARLTTGEGIFAKAVRGDFVHEPETNGSNDSFAKKLAAWGVRSLVISPMVVESNVVGVLAVARREGYAFSPTDCEFLRQLTEHVALATHQTQLYGALQRAYDDLRRTQQVVFQQERLRSLGQMASGIAHDINNAISPVLIYTEALLEKEHSLTPQGRQYLTTIQRAIEDVTQTVNRLREFYRQQDSQVALVPLQLNDLVGQVIDLTRARWSDMVQRRGMVIEVVRDLAPGLPRIMGVASEIREALVNLFLNAVDAMPEGGTLTIRTSFTETPASSVRAAMYSVRLEVIDAGVGMDEETRRRCLEPFFTTKGSRGTGLGLAMVYGTIQRHSGDIDIESVPGKGTTIRLTFAAPIDHAAETRQNAEAAPHAIPATLNILLVDDDPIVLRTLRDILETDGHQVLGVNGGQEGIDAFGASVEQQAAFDVVITDLGMPYVDGRKVAGAVKDLSPQTPVILLTGWGQSMKSEGDFPRNVDQILNKPPKLRELRQALARCSSSAKR